jgi:hypothetical protein
MAGEASVGGCKAGDVDLWVQRRGMTGCLPAGGRMIMGESIKAGDVDLSGSELRAIDAMLNPRWNLSRGSSDLRLIAWGDGLSRGRRHP